MGMNEKRSAKGRVSLARFLKSEVTRSYFLEQHEGRYEFKREKIYSFMMVPREVEKLIGYGFFQVVDAFLFIFTFLPLRFIVASWALFTKPLYIAIGVGTGGSGRWLEPSQIIDLMKGLMIIISCCMMSYVDTSMLYHVVKSQSIIKLYMFYNMLEVGDKLMSSFGQDTLDTLHWTATEPRLRKRHHLVSLPHFALASVYVFLHGILILFQATVLNVAMNSSNKALLTVMMSNNFVELKGSVFKKFDRNNLLQVSCSDIRERFHYCILLLLVMVQTLKEFGWSENQLWVLLPDGLMVLMAEMLVDWVKHAFITRFNEIPLEVYREYTETLAHDLISSKRKYAFSDHSDMVSHRMGFISLPMAALTSRILVQSVRLSGPVDWLILLVAYLALTSFRVLNTILILGKACDLLASPRSTAAAAESPRSRHTSAMTAVSTASVTAAMTAGDVGAADLSVHEPYNVFREFAPSPQQLLVQASSCSSRTVLDGGSWPDEELAGAAGGLEEMEEDDLSRESMESQVYSCDLSSEIAGCAAAGLDSEVTGVVSRLTEDTGGVDRGGVLSPRQSHSDASCAGSLSSPWPTDAARSWPLSRTMSTEDISRV